MYCDKCHKEHQPIHDTVDEEIHRFIEANRKWINRIKDGEILKLNWDRDKKILLKGKKYFVYNTNLLEEPFSVRYVGVREHGEGSMFELLDKHMDKIYSYYDVM
jgi:hypothetical protein